MVAVHVCRDSGQGRSQQLWGCEWQCWVPLGLGPAPRTGNLSPGRGPPTPTPTPALVAANPGLLPRVQILFCSTWRRGWRGPVSLCVPGLTGQRPSRVVCVSHAAGPPPRPWLAARPGPPARPPPRLWASGYGERGCGVPSPRWPRFLWRKPQRRDCWVAGQRSPRTPAITHGGCTGTWPPPPPALLPVACLGAAVLPGWAASP